MGKRRKIYHERQKSCKQRGSCPLNWAKDKAKNNQGELWSIANPSADMLIKHQPKQWLDIFEGSGMPYAAVNDVFDTLAHDHGKIYLVSMLVILNSR